MKPILLSANEPDSSCAGPVDPVSGRLHNPWLDWLRFIAALAVVMNHTRTDMFVEYGNLDPSSKGPLTFAWAMSSRLGYEAVLVFFVLSGFLVGGKALSLALDRKFNARSYVIDRAVRIQVPLTGAIAFTCLVSWWVGDPQSAPNVLGNLLSLQNAFTERLVTNVPLWTLSYEVWFYILGGAVAVLISQRRASIIPICIVAFAAIVFSRMHPLYLALWIGGALAYLYKPARASWVSVAIGTLIIGAGVVCCQLALPNLGNPNGLMLRWIAGAALILVGAMLVLPQLYVAPISDGRFARTGTFLASFSYSLYLTHAPVLRLQPFKESHTVTALWLARYVLVILVCMAWAYLFSRCFETVGPALKRRIKLWTGVRSSPPASVAVDHGGGI